MWRKKMWDGHSCPSPLTLVLILILILIRPSILRLSLVSNSDQNQSDGQECPSHTNRPPRALREKRVGTSTRRAENPNPNGPTLVESHLSQPTRKMGTRRKNVDIKNVGRTLLSVAVDFALDLALCCFCEKRAGCPILCALCKGWGSTKANSLGF
jgi:hypothetical protein